MNSEAAARRLWSRPCGKLGGGGVAGKNSGGAGHAGIVVIRFKRTVTVAAPETPAADAE